MTPPPQSLPLIVGAVVGGFVLLGVLRYCIIWYRRKVDNQIPSISEDGISRPKPQPDEPKSDPTPTPSTGHPIALSQIIFSYEQLAIATNGFSENNFIGEGGFGHVHKGVLPNEKVVAVKQLKLESKQGEREFRAEVEVISRIHHKHLVSLVGYCISGEQRLLVYEFVPNGNLEYHLHGLESPTMNWPTRLKIAIGSAKGLAYLHEDCQPKIIHRDIKAANILLDSNFEAKGRPLLAQALEHGNFEAIVDPRLQNDYEPTELARMVACAAACVRHMARSRPRISQYITLLPFLHGKQIVRALEGYLSLDDLNEEISLGTAGNIDYGNDQYKEDLKKFRKMVPISHDQGSSECSGPSTDSALHQSVSSSES
ncbi:proline-rich receptor-like protein kinase perk1 [Quercus suber]|uniref:non-specific serine/threonine protein kinase n=1 Tax=Quercus suber TaxID=58331 RepID=A0AAW0JI59_QUESU